MRPGKGYRPNGPWRMTCELCNVTISTNALARASHERSKKHQAAAAAERVRKEEAAAAARKRMLNL